MDCGPAALKALLEGHGIHASYGRLREACQTDVDGTSIDTMEDAARRLGLDAEQILLPAEHLFLPEAKALPAIVVVRLPAGQTHFEVVWSAHGPFVQVMDPAVGRRFLSRRRFLEELYEHVMPVPAAAWREWAASEEGRAALLRRIRALGLEPVAVAERAFADPGWRTVATLEAAARATEDLVRAQAVRRGREAAHFLTGLFERALRDEATAASVIPRPFWSVRPGPAGASDAEETLFVRGAVLVRVQGARREAPDRAALEQYSAELAAVLGEPPPRPWRELLRLLRAEGQLAMGPILLATLLAGLAVGLEALLFRALIELTPQLGLSGHRVAAMGLAVAFAALLLLLDLPLAAGQLHLGRSLETRLRMALLRKIPRLSDRYFGSRLVSDMAERNHSLHKPRALPSIGGRFLRFACELLATAAGIVWLSPQSALPATLAVVWAFVFTFLAQPLLGERDMRVRGHAAALGRFPLDALLGLSAIRSAGAERALEGEHEAALTEWVRARLAFQRAVAGADGLLLFTGFALSAWIFLGHLLRGSDAGVVLLLAFWAYRLPHIAMEIAYFAWQYPIHRNVTLRLLEPLQAPDEVAPQVGARETPATGPAAIAMEGVSVRVAGRFILEDIDLHVRPGSHVGVVGPSGAGKSTLLGLLLGWYRPAQGRVLCDGQPLEDAELAALRRHTAWVDPALQLWNRSLLDNLRYGGPEDGDLPLATVIEQAQLRSVLQGLPEGHQTLLGEGGGLVSGGEGQRVRLARALLRGPMRLVVLDEPFRGLDRTQRVELLARARRFWKDATLLCVTHDVGETQAFDRVLVVEDGRIAEDGSPRELRERSGSRYRALLEAEEATRRLWSEGPWRKLRLEDGVIVEPPRGSEC
jgi:ATP-binding cassette subfamily B protein